MIKQMCSNALNAPRNLAVEVLHDTFPMCKNTIAKMVDGSHLGISEKGSLKSRTKLDLRVLSLES